MTTHTDALLDTLTKPTRPPRRAVAPKPLPTATRAASAGDPLRCKRKCPGGLRCCLSVRDGRYHRLCICDWEGCVCHGRARYEEGRRG